jgi:hypothetical protein
MVKLRRIFLHEVRCVRSAAGREAGEKPVLKEIPA